MEEEYSLPSKLDGKQWALLTTCGCLISLILLLLDWLDSIRGGTKAVLL